MPDLSGSRDTLLVEADGKEEIYIAEFDINMLREYRKKDVHANAYRRPGKYNLLTDKIKIQPFIREDYRDI